MAYIKQNFEDGQVLKAEHLNHMEQGIEQLSGEIADLIVKQGGDTLTWDGNTEGLEVLQDILYKVSDATPTIEDFANGFSVTSMGMTREFPADYAQPGDGTILLADPDSSVPFAMIKSVGAAAYEGTSPGTYLLSIDMSEFGLAETVVTEQLTIPGYTGFVKETLNPEYLPSVDNIPASWIAALKTAMGI